MERNGLKLIAIALALVVFALGLAGHDALAEPTGGLDQMQQDAVGPLEITWSAVVDGPAFVLGRIPVGDALRPGNPSETALNVLARYRGAFGLRDPRAELEIAESYTDSLGMTHVTFGQMYKGLPVYGTALKIHFSVDGDEVVAINGHYVRNLRLPTVKPGITSSDALAIAREALPKGEAEGPPKLMIYPSPPSCTAGPRIVLAWLVTLRDDNLPARNLYVVDARDGLVIRTEDRLYTGRDRRTYHAGQGTSLPGTLVRSEGEPPYGDTDVDNAHDFAGETYDYYYSTHGRDSYDNFGGRLTSSAHYGSNYANAFWNGSQMVYGDHFPVKDIVAHELTHAVTQHEANLQYLWQSGALNESFSDIFAAMIDRDDWLIGEDLPDDVLLTRRASANRATPMIGSKPAATAKASTSTTGSPTKPITTSPRPSARTRPSASSIAPSPCTWRPNPR